MDMSFVSMSISLCWVCDQIAIINSSPTMHANR